MKWPSQIAESVRADHKVVRQEAAKVVAVLAELPPGEPVPTDTDVDLEGLFQLVLDHLAREEAEVLPEVESGDAWSKERSALLLSHHEAERRAIAGIREQLARHDPAAVPAILAWVEEITEESRREDAELLNPAVMADTLVKVQDGG